MGLDLDYIDGQTPLDEEEKDGLLIPSIATRGELDEFEQQNIEQAVQWTLGRSFKPETVFSEAFIRMVHKRMYTLKFTLTINHNSSPLLSLFKIAHMIKPWKSVNDLLYDLYYY